ncbi:MAG: molybdopterin-binding protein [Anaerolineae bacterium]|nr:molybdopterin-binding protein [Anaerolineae bacterium]MDW8172839.1 molybdopterin-binding protein [Anaerolineae bacterium]
MVQSEFFRLLPVSEALTLWLDGLPRMERCEHLPTARALGRVLAEAPRSALALPQFPRSAMDGYAVRAEDTYGASPNLPAYLRVVGRVPMGQAASQSISSGEALEIATGAMLPPGASAVVMVEKTQDIGGGDLEVHGPVAPGENVVQVGEDVAEGAEILPVGHTLRPQDLGGLLACGITEVKVIARPRLALVGSGDELVAPDQQPAPGQIRDINSYVLAALFEQMGGEVLHMGIARDDFDDLYQRAANGLAQADVLVLTAGSSISTRDLTSAVINKLGAPGVIQHGLAVKPGKPTILGRSEGKAVIGLPGNPVSAYCVARRMIGPLIRHLLGQRPRHAAILSARLSANVPSKAGREDTIPVKLTHDERSLWATPLFGKSNLIFTLIEADGLLTVPLNSGGLLAESLVDVELFA